MFILVTTILKFLLVVLVFVMPLATLLIWMERRQSAYSQDRLGPWRAHFMRVGGLRVSLGGLLHPIADAIKMFFKEYFVPGDADPTDRILHAIAPVIGFVTALLVMAVIPFAPDMPTDAALAPLVWLGGAVGWDLGVWANEIVSQHLVIPMQIARLDAGLLVVFAVSSLGVYGLALAGWSSRNRFALLGGIRASAQAISYEIALGLTVVGVLLAFGSTELQELVHAQNVSSSIGVPYWGVLLQPFGAVLFFTAAMAETKRTPFDIPEAESEIIGYFTEYSSMGFGLFMLGEFVEVVTLSAVFTTLFLGGWSLPWWMGESTLYLPGLSELLSLAGVTLSESGLGAAGFHWLGFAVGGAVFGLKVLLLCAIQLQIRWTLPRFRYDQLMHLGWKSLLPLSLLNVALATVLVAVDPELDVMLYTGIIMLVAFAGVVVAGPREKPRAAGAH